MIRFLLGLLVCSVATLRAELIPAHRLVPHIAGTDAGVPGGIDQYRPGGASARTNLLDVTSATYAGGADKTGAADSKAAIQAAIDASSINDVIYLPVGVYRLDTSLLMGANRSQRTLRGQSCTEDAFVLSRTTLTHGTGTKTLTVPADAGYTTGCGVWIWKWDRTLTDITSITRSGATATVTTPVPHLRATGESITVQGALQADYNITATITVTGANTFTYTVANSPATPATTTYGIRYLDSSLEGPNIWMKGTCTSYSGTTLEVNVTSADNDPNTVGSQTGGVWSMWKVSQVVIDSRSAAQPVLVGSTQAFNDWASIVNQPAMTDITGSPVKGATSFTIANWPGSPPQVGDLSHISVKNQYDANAGETGDSALRFSTAGWEYVTRQNVLVTGVSGSGATRTITFEPALMFDLPAALSPKISSTADSVGGTIDVAKYVGVETVAFFNHDTSCAYGGIGFAQTYGCWAYGVSSHSVPNYCMSTGMAVRCEFRRGWFTHRKGSGSNGGAVVMQSTTAHLIVDCVVGETNDPAWEMFGFNVGCVFAYNYAPASSPNNNHAPMEVGCLLEGNASNYMVADGYFGGDLDTVVLRNYFSGARWGALLEESIVGHYAMRRFSYNNNIIGNIMGKPNYTDGSVGEGGRPNMVSSSFNGHASNIGGTRHRHLSAAGGTLATLTTRSSDTAGTITMATLTATDIQHPNQLDNQNNAIGLRWSGTLAGRNNIQLSNISGSTFDFASGSGVNLPAEGTAVEVFWGNAGYQEFDDDVEGTIVQKGNYVVSGSGGSQTATGGDTIPDSYIYNSKPSWFRSLAWPAYDPSNPTFSVTRIPAGYRYVNGEDPPADGGGSTGTPTYLGKRRFRRR